MATIIIRRCIPPPQMPWGTSHLAAMKAQKLIDYYFSVVYPEQQRQRKLSRNAGDSASASVREADAITQTNNERETNK